MMEKKTATALAQLRAKLRSGDLRRVPSSRQLAMETGLHKNTCAKILNQLRQEGLISHKIGTIASLNGVANDPVDNAIDYLLAQGLDFDSAKEAIVKSLQKRKGITINSPNENLIRCELEDFKFNPNGLIISDQSPDCDFFLKLSDLKQISKEIKDRESAKAIGIISGCQAFREHIFGFLDYDGEIISIEPISRLVGSAFAFCHQVICDYLIADKIKQLAVEYSRESGKRLIIIPAPYLHTQNQVDLRRKIIDD